ncbi:hypothetical protein RZ769_22400 [Enterobacter kobei]|uniref:hypothetical protein n=1 Tax=Enterobacter kobei TaxID=208224 RepID=UPI001DA07CAE|nr:hypothetical protein [Enterobacter kobei]MDV7020645.1 hypothetical protein [Enterobacter kobei]CAE7606969.1 hypothetical protein AI2762V1_2195 [Enterobacter cloacae]CAH3685175.1 hypothetical protein AI2762V1_2195 [Enterobacter cloacae]
MTFTKERLTELSRRENVGAIIGEEIAELARIALASLEAEAVCVIDQSNLDYLKSGSDADVWPASRAEMGDVLLYRSATPAPVSVPDEVTAEDCPAFVKYDVTDVDEAWARGFNACRAAMLQGADGNSPVIPDGWKLVPIDPTKDMLRAGQSVVGFWLNTVHCYSKMLAAAPAAPQQEVTQALAKGMERYGDAMRELAKKEEK